MSNIYSVLLLLLYSIIIMVLYILHIVDIVKSQSRQYKWNGIAIATLKTCNLWMKFYIAMHSAIYCCLAFCSFALVFFLLFLFLFYRSKPRKIHFYWTSERNAAVKKKLYERKHIEAFDVMKTNENIQCIT